MRPLRILRRRMRSLFHRSRQEDELRREMELHFEQLVREQRESGLSEREARLAARREFGNGALLGEAARATWRWTWLEDLAKDAAFGLRLLRKSPGFTATAVISLGLGIGANTAVFSLLKQVVLDTLPVRDPASLVYVSRRTFETPMLGAFSRPLLQDLQDAKGLPFEGFLGVTGVGQRTLLTAEGAEPVSVSVVSGNYYDLLGVRPALGRLISPDDDRRIGEHPVAVLSYRFWDRRFGRSSSILNQTIRLDDRVFTIIGVAAAGFHGLASGSVFDIEIPISMAPYPAALLENRGDWWLDIYGRLRPGADAASAGETLTPVLMRNYEIAGRRPVSAYQRRIRESEHMQATPAGRGLGTPPQWKLALWVLAAMVAAVLLLACVNIAHLLLARASAREREHSVRAAIGAGRGRLIRQQLTESMLLAALGGVCGVAVAYAMTSTLVHLMVTDQEHSTLQVSPDLALLGFNFAVALAVGVLFGLAPALRASRPSLMEGLKGTFSTRVGRLAPRKLLISIQIAVSVVLLMGASLFARTLASFRGLDVGFRTERLLEFGLNPAGYPADQLDAFYQRVREEIGALPGVEAVAVGRQPILGGRQWGSGISIEGREVPEQEQSLPRRDAVSSGYFSVLGMPLVGGREFTQADDASAPKVALVNETFARHFFGGENPIGKRIGEGGHPADTTIVGVVRDSKYSRLREEPMQFWWVPYRQVGLDRVGNALTLFVRTAGDPEGLIRGVRAAVSQVDPRMALFSVRTVEAQIDENLQIERLMAILSFFFGGVAALLAAIGLFGVLAYSVARREREIGIRIALGASPWEASWAILREVALYVFLGLAAGLGAAALAGSLVEGLLFGVQPRDLLSMAGACGAMGAIAFLAGFIPARRAASVPPAIAFRAE